MAGNRRPGESRAFLFMITVTAFISVTVSAIADCLASPGINAYGSVYASGDGAGEIGVECLATGDSRFIPRRFVSILAVWQEYEITVSAPRNNVISPAEPKPQEINATL